MAASRCPVREDFDPLAPEFLADPYAVLAALRPGEAPLFYAPSIGYYVLTRYADIERVFRDPASFSAAAAQAPLVPLVPEAAEILLAGGHRPQPSMVSLDPPRARPPWYGRAGRRTADLGVGFTHLYRSGRPRAGVVVCERA